LVIEVDTALLLQQQLGVSLGVGDNATIFEICAAINDTGLDITAVIDLLEAELDVIVEAQVDQLILQIIAALAAVGIDVPAALVTVILDSIDIDAIVAEIIADVEVSLGILEACLEATIEIESISVQSTAPESAALDVLSSLQQISPSIQQNSQPGPSGDPMLQLQSSLSPIL
jgi:hypothetical protein